MKHHYMKLLTALLLGGTLATANAQESKELLLAPMNVFVPHWQVGVAVGAGYDIGEAKFSKLVSPALQLNAAYHFNEFLAARLSVEGISSRNRYAFPETKYQWNYVQPALDLKVDLNSLFMGWVSENVFRPYAFAGVGLNVSFNNKDAENAYDNSKKVYGIREVDFQKLWRDYRLNPVVRAGLGFDWWVTDKIAVTGEANANLLPDYYNSKRGRNDNHDWRFNALVGVRFRLGESNRQTEAVWAERTVRPVQQPVKRISRSQADLTVNIQFIINQSIIRETELQKLYELVTYLQDHPADHVLLTGYADKETGNPTINERLSRERADAVGAFLVSRGISSDRVHKDHKGDRIQPFDFPAQNRVCICIVIDQKYL